LLAGNNHHLPVSTIKVVAEAQADANNIQLAKFVLEYFCSAIVVFM